MVRTEILQRFKIDQSKIHVIIYGVDTKLFPFFPVYFLIIALTQKKVIREQWDIPCSSQCVCLCWSGFWAQGLLQSAQVVQALPENCYLLLQDMKNASNSIEQKWSLGINLEWIFRTAKRMWFPAMRQLMFLFFLQLYDPFQNVVLESIGLRITCYYQQK